MAHHCPAGVVMGCPSDSPDDYTALQELKAKPKLREKFNVQDSWVEYDVRTLSHLLTPLLTPLLQTDTVPPLAFLLSSNAVYFFLESIRCEMCS